MANTTIPISPSDEELIPVLRALRAEFPTLGINKFHALLLQNQPSWAVSEKRFKKVLQQHCLNSMQTIQPQQSGGGGEGKKHPTFRFNEQLNVENWTKKVEVKYFGPEKGKGLVAKEKIENGEKLWKEDPWVIAPEWDIYNAQEASLACTHCTTPLSDSRLIVSCPAASPCLARFCNRLCLTKSMSIHPLLCRAQNPAVVPVIDLAKRSQWLGLHALVQQTARILLANEKGSDEIKEQWKIVRGFAEMGMEDRIRENGQTTSARDRKSWENAHKLYMNAFRSPIDTNHQKKLSRLLKRPLPDDIEAELFSYEAFLRGLGRMNLNLEAHGGLYILHSHLNHACTPNISVRHLDQRTSLARITMLALEDIEPGKELLVTYVDPTAGVRERRRQLREWGFGECGCDRCVNEAAELAPEGTDHNRRDEKVEGTSAANGLDRMDLERELREGFGL
ncbi:SET domain-containing protein [Ramaria rubella]|nr:SET domain-containing protein [Ramaria rubella]